MPYTNGFTKVTDKNIWNKYNNDWMFIDEKDCKHGFYKISPNLIFINQFKEYRVNLVEKLDGKYSLFISPSLEIKENDNIKSDFLFKDVMESIITSCDAKEVRRQPLTHLGYVKDVTNYPDCMSIIFKASVTKTFNRNEEYTWMNLNELIDKYGKFDSLSKHLIDFFVKERKNVTRNNFRRKNSKT